MHDIVIKGGLIVDGSGNEPYAADVAIRRGRIDQIGTIASPATEEWDASGHVVAPGFIDMHAHSEPALLSAPSVDAKTRQGVTTEVLGQDGIGITPTTAASRQLFMNSYNAGSMPSDWDWSTLTDFAAKVDGRIAVNAAFLAPHASIRASVVGFDDRAPTTSELGAMRRLTEEIMSHGAFGLSAGLTYAPGMYADNDELTALCAVVAAHDGYYSPHHRSYGVGAMAAYRECVDISQSSGVRLHLTHASLMHEENRHAAPTLLDIVDTACSGGIETTLDIYPYTAAEGTLGAMLPGWMHEGSPTAALDRLKDPSIVEQLRHVMEIEGSDGFQGAPVPWEKVQIGEVQDSELDRFVGSSIADVATALGTDAFNAFVYLLKADRMRSGFVEHTAYEDNLRQIMQHPRLVFGSDGAVNPGYVHPRAFGTFPRVLGRYVRQYRTLGLPEAIRKMTSAPAEILGLEDRGRVAEGFHADLVCFDPDSVIDRATYEKPRQHPIGIRDVIVAGEPTIRHNRPSGRLPGRVLRHVAS